MKASIISGLLAALVITAGVSADKTKSVVWTEEVETVLDSNLARFLYTSSIIDINTVAPDLIETVRSSLNGDTVHELITDLLHVKKTSTMALIFIFEALPYESDSIILARVVEDEIHATRVSLFKVDSILQSGDDGSKYFK